MTKTLLPNGDVLISFSSAVWEAIKSRTKLFLRMTDWTIHPDKTWSVTVDGTTIIKGTSINDVIDNVNKQYGS